MDYDPREIANEFLFLANDERKPVNAMKLQKLVYYAYGWGLATLGEPLFISGVEAWDYGPIIPIVYYEFRRYGNEPIIAYALGCDHATLKVHSKNVEQDAIVRKLIRKVWDTHKDYTAIQLANSTHVKGSPWEQVYSVSNGVSRIDDAIIKEWFEE